MLKKSQITLFIIFGLFILAIFILISISRSSFLSRGESIPEKSEIIFMNEPIARYVDACIDEAARVGITMIGLRGGYIFPSDKRKVTNKTEIAIFYDGKEYAIPSMEDIGNELSYYIETALPSCLDNFSIFKIQGYNISHDRIRIKTLIKDRVVVVEANVPIVYVKNSQQKSISEFSRTYSVSLGTLYSIANEITEDQIAHPNSIDFSLLGNLSESHDIRPVIISKDEGSVIYLLLDNQSAINDAPYLFQFAHSFQRFNCSNLAPGADVEMYIDCTDEEISSTYKLSIKDIPRLEAFVGRPFRYVVSSNGLQVTYWDYSSLFEIDKATGTIYFTPSSDQVGIHRIELSAKDVYGNEDDTSFLLQISEEK